MKTKILVGAAAALATLLLAACGTAAPAAAPPAAAPQNDAFPVTVTHKLGATTIKAAPQRVVAVGLRDQDFALALGVKPIGVAQWFEGYTIGPWATAAAGDVKPTVIGSAQGPNLEAVAALKPDLILSIYATADKAVYDKLSQIAPTIAGPVGTEDYALSWQDQLKLTGQALGQTQKADTLTKDVEAKIAKVKTDHPEFAGKTIVYGGLGGDPGAYTSTDQRGRFLTSLGFTIPKNIDGLATTESAFFAAISKENFRYFDTDVAIIIGPSNDPATVIASEPLYKDLKVVQDGRTIFFDELKGAWSGALSFNSPLSLPYALDGFVAALAAAADGNPTTVVPKEPQLLLGG